MMRVDKETLDLLKPMPPFVALLRGANRRGLKSQTRRVIVEQNRLRNENGVVEYLNMFGSWQEWVPNAKTFRCKYGKAGDVRYMREPLVRGLGDDGSDIAHYKDDNFTARSLLTGEPIKWRWRVDTLSQLYMPKEAARTFKRYKFIAVERLQEISEESCIAEGVRKNTLGLFEIQLPDDQPAGYVRTTSASFTFRVFWDAINEKRGYGWRSNPWVWVIGYEEVKLLEITSFGSDGREYLIVDDAFDDDPVAKETIEEMFREPFQGATHGKVVGPIRIPEGKV